MALSEEEVAAFEDYFYHITAAKGSGEHALRHILKPFAWAQQPLEGQLQHLKVILVMTVLFLQIPFTPANFYCYSSLI